MEHSETNARTIAVTTCFCYHLGQGQIWLARFASPYHTFLPEWPHIGMLHKDNDVTVSKSIASLNLDQVFDSFTG